MNNHLSRLISLIYLPVITRDKSQFSTFLLIIALSLAFMAPHVSADKPETTDSKSVINQMTAIKISDITGQAEEVEDLLQRIETELSKTNVEEQARETLDNLNNEIKTMLPSLDNSLSSHFDIFKIQELSSTGILLKRACQHSRNYSKNGLINLVTNSN